MSTAHILNRSMTQLGEGSKTQAEAQFQEVFLAHYERVVAVLARLVPDPTRAEELASEVFWKLYREPSLLVSGGNLGGWLYRTATNLGIDSLRADSRRARYEQAAGRAMYDAQSRAKGPLQDVLREEECQRVRAVLASLKPAQAQLLILRASGLSYRELADTLEVKVTGVGTMLNRAQEEFRKRYLELYGHAEEL